MGDVLKFRGDGKISVVAADPIAASWPEIARSSLDEDTDSPPTFAGRAEPKHPLWVGLAILLGSSALLWWGIIRVGSAILSAE